MSAPSPEDRKVPDRDPAAQYTIDQLAAKTGVPSRTIRFYQAKGVLPPPISAKGSVAARVPKTSAAQSRLCTRTHRAVKRWA